MRAWKAADATLTTRVLSPSFSCSRKERASLGFVGRVTRPGSADALEGLCQRDRLKQEMSESIRDVTRLLRRLDGGDREALREILPLVYDELRRIASARLSRERADHTLRPTELVHEAWLRLEAKDKPRWNDRKHRARGAGWRPPVAPCGKTP